MLHSLVIFLGELILVTQQVAAEIRQSAEHTMLGYDIVLLTYPGLTMRTTEQSLFYFTHKRPSVDDNVTTTDYSSINIPAGGYVFVHYFVHLG
jgi:hypothetical protein